MVFLPESLRWLAQHGRTDDVLKNLCRLRDLPADHPEILQELKEIEDAAELDRQAKSGKWTELFQRENLHRLFIGIMLQIFQQWTGSNAIVSSRRFINRKKKTNFFFFFFRTITGLISSNQLALIAMKLKF